MAIKTFRIVDPHSGEVTYTDNPKSYQGRWYHPLEYRRKIDESREAGQRVQKGYRKFRKIVAGFKDS